MALAARMDVAGARGRMTIGVVGVTVDRGGGLGLDAARVQRWVCGNG